MPSNVLVTIAYSVPRDKQQQFATIVTGLVQKINSVQQNVKVSVYSPDGEPNSYVEVYECDSIDSYDALEDSLDEDAQTAIRRIATEFATARQAVTTMKKVY